MHEHIDRTVLIAFFIKEENPPGKQVDEKCQGAYYCNGEKYLRYIKFFRRAECSARAVQHENIFKYDIR